MGMFPNEIILRDIPFKKTISAGSLTLPKLLFDYWRFFGEY
jgi:hypothetical protein